jgi:hypothetical protein
LDWAWLMSRIRERRFRFTELECRAAERGVKVVVWQVQDRY